MSIKYQIKGKITHHGHIIVVNIYTREGGRGGKERVGGGERETETETDRKRQRQRDRERERERERRRGETDRQTETERDRDTERHRQRDTQREGERERERGGGREREKEGERERGMGREWGDTDRQTGRQGQRQHLPLIKISRRSNVARGGPIQLATGLRKAWSEATADVHDERGR